MKITASQMYIIRPFPIIENETMLRRNVFLVLIAFSMSMLASQASAQAPAKAAACAACHGADGNSTTPIWPKLAGQGAPYIVAQLKAFKSKERDNPSMSPMAAGLEEADMREIADYYAAQSTQIAALGDEDFSAAEKLYRGGDAERALPACMACHGPNGAGNAPAGFPALRGQHADYTVLQLNAYRDGSRAGGRNMVMGDIAKKMTDEEIAALAKYVSALH